MGTCTSTDRLTVSVPFLWYRYVACARMVVNSTVHSGSYKTESADSGKAKSWDTCATNCEAGTREREQRTCTSYSVSPSLAFTYVSFLAGHFYTNLFFFTSTHSVLDKTCAHVMLTGVHKTSLSLSMPCHAMHIRLAPNNDNLEVSLLFVHPNNSITISYVLIFYHRILQSTRMSLTVSYLNSDVRISWSSSQRESQTLMYYLLHFWKGWISE